MLNGNTVSIKQLIGEIYSSHRYKYELNYGDAIAWSVESLELIGAPQSLTPKIVKLKIENYRSSLPCDLSTITQVGGSISGCNIFPMTTSTNSFHPVLTCSTQIFESLLSENNSGVEVPIGQDISGNPMYEFQNGIMSMPETISDTSSLITGNNATYNVSDNYIFTNFKDGYVFMAYNALPVDEEGFPMIPDNRRFKEAVKAYIVSKIDYILYRNNELSKDLFNHSEQEWLFYVASAGNAARIPNADGMQSIINQMKLIPNKFSHNLFFKNI